MWEEELLCLLEDSFQDAAIFGIGERPYPRVGPGLIFDRYGIICGMHTGDVEDIRTLTRVDCFQELFPQLDHPRDSLHVLENDLLQKRGLLPPRGSFLLLYRLTESIRQIATERGWIPLANRPEIWRIWDNKALFRKRAISMGLPTLEFELVDPEDLTPFKCSQLINKWGSPLMVQVPDFPRGGGRGSFLIQEPDESLKVLSKLFPEGPTREIMISPWINGVSLSIEGCVGPWGVMVSPLQVQLVDLEEVLPKGGIGRFCGHQWGFGIPNGDSLEEKAGFIASSIGREMARDGYRGIFGLDFIWDPQKDKLLLLECNPRYTGAFPTLTLLELAVGVPPMEAFHMLSFSQNPAEKLSQRIIDARQRSLPPFSQVILFHRGKKGKKMGDGLAAGRYSWSHERKEAKRIGSIFPIPKCPFPREEFLVVDGPPPPGYPLAKTDPLERVVRIVFFREVTDRALRRFSPDISEIIGWAYRKMGLEA